MAELLVDGGELVLHLSATEKVGAVHGDLRVPLSSVRQLAPASAQVPASSQVPAAAPAPAPPA
jgi:hypothetical protein